MSYRRAVQTVAAIYRLWLLAVRSIIIVGFLLGIYRHRPAHMEWVFTLYVRSLQNNEV